MEKQTKNLGHVTAYGYAKAQGYTGTEEEYAQLMASYSSVAERAEAAAQEAAESAREASDVIPEVTAQDNGKVMMVENGEWGAGEVDVLPTVTTQDNGKVLGVVEGQWAPAEPTGGSGLPEVTSEDNGDLLSVVDGAWAKSEPGYRVETVEGTEIAPEQSVTTATGQVPLEIAGEITYNEWPSPVPSSLSVSFNGTEYTVPLYYSGGGNNLYGEFDAETAKCLFTTYPCGIEFFESTSKLALITEAAGTFTVSVSVPETRNAIPTEDFKLAVNNSYMVTTETEKVTIPEQSVTTAVPEGGSVAFCSVADFTMPGENDTTPWPDTLHVTFNGTEYDLPRADPTFYQYGAPLVDDAPDFTTYPIQVEYVSDGGEQCFIATSNAGTYTLSATYTESTTALTEKFKEAVNNLVSTGAWFEVEASGVIDSQTEELTLECTPEDIGSAISRGQNLYFRAEVAVDGGTGGAYADCPLVVYEFENTGYFEASGTLIAVGNSSIAIVSVSIGGSGASCTYHEVTFS